jgi:hypothetical protein
LRNFPSCSASTVSPKFVKKARGVDTKSPPPQRMNISVRRIWCSAKRPRQSNSWRHWKISASFPARNTTTSSGPLRRTTRCPNSQCPLCATELSRSRGRALRRAAVPVARDTPSSIAQAAPSDVSLPAVSSLGGLRTPARRAILHQSAKTGSCAPKNAAVRNQAGLVRSIAPHSTTSTSNIPRTSGSASSVDLSGHVQPERAIGSVVSQEARDLVQIVFSPARPQAD